MLVRGGLKTYRIMVGLLANDCEVWSINRLSINGE